MRRCVEQLVKKELEFVSKADQRVLRFGHVERMDEYRMARRVLMTEVSGGGYEVDRYYGGWMSESDLGQQRENCGGCASMRKRYEGLKNPCEYVDA